MSIEPGQVWEHRAFCRLCKTTQAHRHRYVVVAVSDGHAMVRDLSTSGGNRLEPYSRYARPLTVFGSLAKGGLRLAGHMTNNRFTPLPDYELDTRLVDHVRVSLRSVPMWRGKLLAEETLAA